MIFVITFHQRSYLNEHKNLQACINTAVLQHSLGRKIAPSLKIWTKQNFFQMHKINVWMKPKNTVRVSVCVEREREREWQTDRDRQTDRETETYRQTDRQADREREGQPDRQRQRHRERQRQTGRQSGRQTETERDRQTERQKNKVLSSLWMPWELRKEKETAYRFRHMCNTSTAQQCQTRVQMPHSNSNKRPQAVELWKYWQRMVTTNTHFEHVHYSEDNQGPAHEPECTTQTITITQLGKEDT